MSGGIDGEKSIFFPTNPATGIGWSSPRKSRFFAMRNLGNGEFIYGKKIHYWPFRLEEHFDRTHRNRNSNEDIFRWPRSCSVENPFQLCDGDSNLHSKHPFQLFNSGSLSSADSRGPRECAVYIKFRLITRKFIRNFNLGNREERTRTVSICRIIIMANLCQYRCSQPG